MGRLNEYRLAKNHDFGLRQRAESIAQLGDPLKETLETLVELSEHIDAENLAAFRAVQVTCRERLDQVIRDSSTPEAALEVAAWGIAFESLRGLRELATALISRAWLGLTATRAGLERDDLIVALSKVPGFAGAAQQLLRIRGDLEQSKRLTLPKASDVRDLKKRLTEWDEAWASIEEAVPSSVASFLTEATTSGAELASLTEPTRAWLRDHEIESLFRIRIK